MLRVEVVINNDEQKNRIATANISNNVVFTFFDERNRNGLKEGRKVKSYFSARLTPFAAILDERDIPMKAFYSEAGDSIGQLIKYLENV